MKAYVYTDKSLARYAGRFVWLSVNTEAAANAPFLKRYPIPALPTLLVLDPKRDAVALRYVGGATVPQLEKLLTQAERTYFERGQSAADKQLAEGDRLASAGQNAEAAKAYDQAIANAPKSWKSFGRATESLMFSLSLGDDNERCATRALQLYPRVKGSASAANVAATGLSCATGIDEKNAKRASVIDALEKATREVFDDPKIVLSGDDRSGLYMSLIDARETVKDEAGALKLKREWSAFLDKVASEAKTPEQRFVYDPHRLTAYIDLHTPEKAIPMLEQSERDFPDDYNPPARLAIAYKEMKEYDKAIAASDRALARVYGPRKLIVLGTRADIFLAKGDKDAARAAIAQALEYAKSLPEGQRSERRIASLEKRLASMQ